MKKLKYLKTNRIPKLETKDKTKRRFLPNLHKKRIWVPSQQRYVTLRVSTRGLRTIDKIGIEAALERINNNQDIN